MWVVRVDSSGKLCDSKPCSHCTIALKQVGIKGVYYTTSEGKIKYEKVKLMDNNHSTPFQKRQWGNNCCKWNF